MAKLFFILSVTLALQSCITAAPNAEDRPQNAYAKILKVEQPDPIPIRSLYTMSEGEGNENKGLQGQRQKRFYDYFDFDFPPFGVYYNHNNKRDDSQNTDVHGAQDFMLQILRRVQTILSYTRQQALSPPAAHYPVPSFVPLYYIPRGVCDCTPAEIPSNGQETNNDPRPTLPTTTTPPADSTTQGISPVNEPGPSPTADTDKTTLDFPSRLPDIDEEDGSRPISFVPVQPKRPLSRPPPPVDHGSSQASSGNGVMDVASTTPPPVVAALAPQPHLPTNSIPTLCDGAVLTCCHRAEVTYDCFTSQGCPYPSSPDNPCDPNVILKVINKFQYYYANRRG